MRRDIVNNLYSSKNLFAVAKEDKCETEIPNGKRI